MNMNHLTVVAVLVGGFLLMLLASACGTIAMPETAQAIETVEVYLPLVAKAENPPPATPKPTKVPPTATPGPTATPSDGQRNTCPIWPFQGNRWFYLDIGTHVSAGQGDPNPGMWMCSRNGKFGGWIVDPFTLQSSWRNWICKRSDCVSSLGPGERPEIQHNSFGACRPGRYRYPGVGQIVELAAIWHQEGYAHYSVVPFNLDTGWQPDYDLECPALNSLILPK